ncbi:hypothetical protein LY90DRAFT_57942 [Neocallimastix californiae]|uniref:Ras-GEF domain-containing protein n=1 Tax=Neocallimastix californiae TaxID=1754190 RepID=A0A1Y2BRN3_9FUNG|nr:hypothetical protein LY90DRAFT_57942 [Neocallimastix californiae]|eukprot:ORY36795.1 hypothetical protein LY90DRAFT_57942 [Neocallimastix californiae]
MLEQENEVKESMPHIEDLDIDTNADNQIPNDKTFNKMISSSTITDPGNANIECENYYVSVNKSNTLPITNSTHLSEKRLSEVEEQDKKKSIDEIQELFRNTNKVTRTNLDDCMCSPNTSDVNINIFEVDPKDIARQMCLMNARIFKQITQDELLSLAWNKPNKK